MRSGLPGAARRRGGPPPGSPRDTVIVLRPDTPASPELLDAARQAGGTVAVVAILRVHGFAFGLPNPGLLPTRSERARAEAAVASTLSGLRKAGLDADGQIVVTRKAAKAIAGVVHRRGARQVLMEQPTGGRLRRLVEGDPVRALARRVKQVATVETA
ncbi:hypothetical protein [Nocardia sp. NPDC004722]